MSRHLLTKLASEMYDTLVQKAISGRFRDKAEALPGQLFYWNRRNFHALAKKAYMSYGVPDVEASKKASILANEHKRLLDVEESKALTQLSSDRLAALNKADIGYVKGVLKKKDPVWFIVSAARLKKDIRQKVGEMFAESVGYTREGNEPEFLKARAAITGTQLKNEPLKGQQIGHGDMGFSLAGMKASGAAALLDKVPQDAPEHIEFAQSFAQFQINVPTEFSIFKSVAIDSQGNWQALFVPILTAQNAIFNSRHAKQEAKFFKALTDDIEKLKNRLATTRGSESLEEAAIVTTLENLTKIKKGKLISDMKPKKAVKSKTTSRKLKKNVKAGAGIVTLKGTNFSVPRDPNTGRFVKRQQSTTSLMNLINAKLPDVVAKNMVLPRLRWRTGRFAESVKVVGMQQTPKGFPTIAYTYMKDPYQVFEMGLGRAPWATPDRDPRQIIDLSIREIAQTLAMQRFYTRRV